MKNLELTNHGERLVPGYSHNLAEVIRHKSSYYFFKKIILHDQKYISQIRILEIGCGTGHGTYMLSSIPNCHIVAIDVEKDAVSFAMNNFHAKNITYICAKVDELKLTEQFDYIISRHSFEHIENIFHDILNYTPRRRLMVNVPYKELPGNIYHVYFNIDESMFTNWPLPNFFYEDLDGKTYAHNDRDSINSIVCISSFDSSLDRISDVFEFPLPAWEPNYLEALAYENLPRMFGVEKELAATQHELIATQHALADANARLSIPLVRLSLYVWKSLIHLYRMVV